MEEILGQGVPCKDSLSTKESKYALTRVTSIQELMRSSSKKTVTRGKQEKTCNTVQNFQRKREDTARKSKYY